MTTTTLISKEQINQMKKMTDLTEFTEAVVATATPELFVFKWLLDASLFKTTIFEKKKMVEVADIEKVYGFIKAEMGISYLGQKRYDGVCEIYKTELEQINKFKEMYNKKLKKFQTGFHLPKHKWGRVIPNNYLSLSIFHRPTRHSFCLDKYVDIDMVNAQPTIINEICIMNNILTNKYLAKYVENPKKYREFVMKHHNCSKDIAKNLFICLMFGGCYNSWIKDNNISTNEDKKNWINDVCELEIEMKSVMEIVYNANPQIKKDVLKQDPSKWKTDDEAKRGVMALWSQSVERLLQETAIMFLVEKKKMKLEEIVPCQDGFMILKEYDYPELINDVNKIVKEKFNIGVPFIEKPFDEAIEIPIYEDFKSFDEWEDLLSAKKLGDRFIEEFSNYINKNGNCLYVYWGSSRNETNEIVNGRWYDETDKEKRYKLSLYISEDLYDILHNELLNAVELTDKELSTLMKLLRNQTSRGANINDVIRHILPKAKSSDEDFNSNPFLIGFNNGVYDLLADEFRDYRFSDYITLSTRYNYVKVNYENEANQKLKEELATLIETIHPDKEHRLLYLQVLASGLDGRAYQKLFLFNGAGGNGKGLTGSLMDIILGDYYHQPSNGILKDVEKSNSPSPDMYNLKNKRYINFKEVAGSVRVAMLRNLSGGGKFSGRLLNQNPEQFFMSGTFVMEFNNAPELDGKPQRADYRRLVDLFFPVNFTDNPDMIGKEIGGVLYREANTYYETQEFLNKMRPIFLDLLLGVYRAYKDKEGKKGMIFTIPASIRKRTEAFIENQNLFQKYFYDAWKKVDIDVNKTDDEKNKTIQLKDIWRSFENSEDYRKLTYRDKRQYGRDEFYKWICEQFKVEGNAKTGKIIKGLMRRDDSDDYTPDEEDTDSETASD